MYFTSFKKCPNFFFTPLNFSQWGKNCSLKNMYISSHELRDQNEILKMCDQTEMKRSYFLNPTPAFKGR